MNATSIFSRAVLSLCLLGSSAISVRAAESPTLVQPDAFEWAPAEGLPPGAEITVLYGNPGNAGPFAIRFRFPAGYEVATHAHSTDEFITVLSGQGRMAFGESAVASAAQPLVPGVFMTLPAGAWHHLWIDADTIVELHSTGPFDFELVGH
jgi:quercetin dioxygenase-like cupin family protein